MMTTTHDPRFSDMRRVFQLAGTRMWGATGARRSVIVANLGDDGQPVVLDEAGGLDFDVLAVHADASYVAACGVNGFVAFSNADATGTVRSYSVQTTGAWIVVRGNFVVLPTHTGGIVVYNHLTGVLAGGVAKLDGVLNECSVAYFDPDNLRLYLADGNRPLGAVISFDASGGLFQPTFEGTFATAQCRDLVRIAFDGIYLFIAGKHTIAQFDLTDWTAPEVVQVNRYMSRTITDFAVLGVDAYWVGTADQLETSATAEPYGRQIAAVDQDNRLLQLVAPDTSRWCSCDEIPYYDAAGLADLDTITGTLTPDAASLAAVKTNGACRDIVIVGHIAYIVGDFTTVTDASGTATRNHAAALNLFTGFWTSWNPNVTGTTVHAIEYDGTQLLLGGDFTTIGATARANFARIALDGTLSSFNPGPNGVVYAVRLVDDGIYIGGAFTTVGGQARTGGIARLTITAGVVALDTSFGPVAATYSSTTSVIRTIEDAGTSKLALGGRFVLANQISDTCIVADSNGAPLNAAVSGCARNSGGVFQVRPVVELDRVYVSGDFGSVGAPPAWNGTACVPRMAAFKISDGTLDTAWVPGPTSVYSTAIFYDSGPGVLVAGGDWSGISAQIAKFDTGTGARVGTWAVTLSGGAPYVYRIQRYRGIYLVAHAATTVQGSTANPYLTAIDVDTAARA